MQHREIWVISWAYKLQSCSHVAHHTSQNQQYVMCQLYMNAVRSGADTLGHVWSRRIQMRISVGIFVQIRNTLLQQHVRPPESCVLLWNDAESCKELQSVVWKTPHKLRRVCGVVIAFSEFSYNGYVQTCAYQYEMGTALEAQISKSHNVATWWSHHVHIRFNEKITGTGNINRPVSLAIWHSDFIYTQKTHRIKLHSYKWYGMELDEGDRNAQTVSNLWQACISGW